MRIKLFLFFLILITVCSAVLAAPVPKTVVSNGINEGLTFKYELFDILPQNTAHYFYFHIYNSTNGIPFYSNTPFSCDFHLYNQTGEHIVDRHYTNANFDVTHNEDIEVYIAAGNFSQRGKYQYIFNCNTSSLGGYVAHNFYITGSGFDSEEDTKYIYILMVIGLIAFACILMYASNVLQGEHPMHTALRMVFMASAFLLCYMAIGSVGGLLVYSDSTAITSTAVQNILNSDVGDSISVAGWVLRIVGAFALILLIWWAFDRANETKWKKMTGAAYEQEKY